MIFVGPKQRLCTALSIALGAGRELGLVKGTLGAAKVVARLWGGDVASTTSSHGIRPSWDGTTNVASSPSGVATHVAETRDVNGLTEITGAIWIIRPTGERLFEWPAFNLVMTPSATTLITVDAWVFYDVDYATGMLNSSLRALPS